MPNIQIFEPALCCNTGVCGVDVDQTLVTFTADVAWFKTQGVQIERFNLAQQPLVFADNAVVSAFLMNSGAESLPLTLLDNQIVLAGRYATRQELARWAQVPLPDVHKPQIKGIVKSSGCGGSGCC